MSAAKAKKTSKAKLKEKEKKEKKKGKKSGEVTAAPTSEKVSQKRSKKKEEVAAAPASAPLEKKAKGKKETAVKAKKGKAAKASTSVEATLIEVTVTSTEKSKSAAKEMCREIGCDLFATSAGYCRLHYIKNWKRIKRREAILKEGKLNRYIEELVAKYPDKYIEAIRQDLAADKDFSKVVTELELEEALDNYDAEDAESIDSLIEGIKRDYDDDDGDLYE